MESSMNNADALPFAVFGIVSVGGTYLVVMCLHKTGMYEPLRHLLKFDDVEIED